jgi:hypothetical protein
VPHTVIGRPRQPVLAELPKPSRRPLCRRVADRGFERDERRAGALPRRHLSDRLALAKNARCATLVAPIDLRHLRCVDACFHRSMRNRPSWQFVQASEELNLSQSAVSRLVKQVEEALDVPLFARVKQRLILTEAGRAYAKALRATLPTLRGRLSGLRRGLCL